jgi:hypothetical protein
MVELIVRLATENRTWGVVRIQVSCVASGTGSGVALRNCFTGLDLV